MVLDAYTRLGILFAGKVLVDKEPLEPIAFPDRDYGDFLRSCFAILPELRVVYMVRDPVSTIWSMSQREWGHSVRDVEASPLPLETHLQTWIDCAELASRVRNDPRVYLCRYEALVNDPAAESARVADFLGLRGRVRPFEPRASDSVGFGPEERERILTATASLRTALGV
jgi:hypothetical protein